MRCSISFFRNIYSVIYVCVRVSSIRIIGSLSEQVDDASHICCNGTLDFGFLRNRVWIMFVVRTIFNIDSYSYFIAATSGAFFKKLQVKHSSRVDQNKNSGRVKLNEHSGRLDLNEHSGRLDLNEHSGRLDLNEHSGRLDLNEHSGRLDLNEHSGRLDLNEHSNLGTVPTLKTSYSTYKIRSVYNILEEFNLN